MVSGTHAQPWGSQSARCVHLLSSTSLGNQALPFPWPAGEHTATRDSFVSVLWRLIPYWLNRWEHTWGAEVSSMMFELPHFATELLIILPIVQVSYGSS